jgi:hypothetical protein
LLPDGLLCLPGDHLLIGRVTAGAPPLLVVLSGSSGHTAASAASEAAGLASGSPASRLLACARQLQALLARSNEGMRLEGDGASLSAAQKAQWWQVSPAGPSRLP